MLTEANGKQTASEREAKREAKRRRIEQLMDELFANPPEDVGAAYKNILSEFHGVVKPASEKTEAVIRAENFEIIFRNGALSKWQNVECFHLMLSGLILLWK